jgi:ABC-2 type transport system permease protein
MPLAAVPPAAALLGADRAGLPLWTAIPVGVVSGAFAAWFFGRRAFGRLERQGPELLGRMRSRPMPRSRADGTATAIPGRVWVGVLVGSLLLFPQSLVPLAIRLSGSETKLWFVPLYLPGALQLAAILAFGVAGVLAYAWAWRTYARARHGAPGGHWPAHR